MSAQSSFLTRTPNMAAAATTDDATGDDDDDATGAGTSWLTRIADGYDPYNSGGRPLWNQYPRLETHSVVWLSEHTTLCQRMVDALLDDDRCRMHGIEPVYLHHNVIWNISNLLIVFRHDDDTVDFSGPVPFSRFSGELMQHLEWQFAQWKTTDDHIHRQTIMIQRTIEILTYIAARKPETRGVMLSATTTTDTVAMLKALSTDEDVLNRVIPTECTIGVLYEFLKDKQTQGRVKACR